jgi:hypothetical protein
MFLRCLFAVATFAVCSATARAETFELSTTFISTSMPFSIDYEMVTGPITIDTITGTVTAADLTVTAYAGKPSVAVAAEQLGGAAGDTIFQEAVTYSGSLGLPPATFPSPTTYYQLVVSDSANTNYMVLNFPVASLVGYSGGGLCTLHGLVGCPTYFGPIGGTLTYNFDGLSGFNEDLSQDSLEPAAVPESSTFALIGTGVIGLAGAFRRQRLARLGRKPTTRLRATSKR